MLAYLQVQYWFLQTAWCFRLESQHDPPLRGSKEPTDFEWFSNLSVSAETPTVSVDVSGGFPKQKSPLGQVQIYSCSTFKNNRVDQSALQSTKIIIKTVRRCQNHNKIIKSK